MQLSRYTADVLMKLYSSDKLNVMQTKRQCESCLKRSSSSTPLSNNAVRTRTLWGAAHVYARLKPGELSVGTDTSRQIFLGERLSRRGYLFWDCSFSEKNAPRQLRSDLRVDAVLQPQISPDPRLKIYNITFNGSITSSQKAYGNTT